MGGLVSDELKPGIAMFVLQFTYAGMALSTRAALLEGMSPRVFVVYRHAVATLSLAPIAYFSRRKSGHPSLGFKSFSLVFLIALFGVTANQNFYFEGMYLGSSSMASAMSNLVPAVTFAIAALVGLEKVDFRRLRSIAKIVGTAICVGGAICMAMLRGPKLLNAEILPIKSGFSSGSDNWLLGCLYLFASCCCWSLWLILQVPASATYPDPLSLTAWMCFFATLQSAAVTLLIEQDPEAWKLHSVFELGCCLYSGVIGSAFSFLVQAWVICRRGPLFSAMFNPLCTVIVTAFAACFMHEEIYSGSLVGAFAVIMGLYVVLWGKAKDRVEIDEDVNPKPPIDEIATVEVLIDPSCDNSNVKDELKEPLLANKLTSVDDTEKNWRS